MKNLFIFSGVLLGVIALGVSFLFGYNYGKNTSNISSSESIELENTISLSENVNLEELLLQQPCYIENTILSDSFFYNDWHLNYIIKNNSDADIQTVTIAYAAWDINDLPIETSIRYGEKAHVQEFNCENANILIGKTSREDDYILIQSTLEVKTCKTIVVSYKDFDGNTWENPCYQTWLDKYDGKKLSND